MGNPFLAQCLTQSKCSIVPVSVFFLGKCYISSNLTLEMEFEKHLPGLLQGFNVLKHQKRACHIISKPFESSYCAQPVFTCIPACLGGHVKHTWALTRPLGGPSPPVRDRGVCSIRLNLPAAG